MMWKGGGVNTFAWSFIGLTALLNISTVELTSLNCTSNKSFCRSACNERNKLSYSATYCDTTSGNCICDCRDTLLSKCTFTPFTPCYNFCVNQNPNPEFFMYVGGECPILTNNFPSRTFAVQNQCACQCSVRDQDPSDNNEI